MGDFSAYRKSGAGLDNVELLVEMMPIPAPPPLPPPRPTNTRAHATVSRMKYATLTPEGSPSIDGDGSGSGGETKKGHRRSRSFMQSLFGKPPGWDAALATPPPPPPAPPKKAPPMLMKQQSIILPTHVSVTFSCPSAGWALDLKLAKSSKLDEIWRAILAKQTLQDPETYGIFTEKGVILNEKESIVYFKVKNKDVLYIKPRLRTEIKQQVKTVLTSFLKRRPEQQELVPSKKPDLRKSAQIDCNPAIVRTCIDYLVTHEGHKQEGIFRISPSVAELQVFYQTLLTQEPDFSTTTSLHTVAAALKQYLRSQPIALLAAPVSTQLATCQRELVNDKDRLIKEVANIISKLPAVHRETLESIFGFLLLVVSNTEYTKMTARNLSIVFAPNIITFDDSLDILKQTQVGVEVVDVIIANWEHIYGQLIAVRN